MTICRHCKLVYTGKRLSSHEARCSSNPERVVSGGSSYRAGKSYEELYGEVKAADIRRKVSNALVGKAVGRKVSAETRLKWKQNAKIGGLRHGAGRGIKGWYKGLWCDSTWELAYVKWHKDKGIAIERNRRFFYYEFEGASHRYYPDFIVDGKLIEIKAYVDDRTLAKLAACPEPVTLVTYGQIEPFIEYAMLDVKAGNSLASLYEPNQAGVSPHSDKV